tara:strand:- start:296 stop:976 length:681 start_codon:yes stop_codon:yes gene_type:complete
MTRDFRLFVLLPTAAFLLGNILLIGAGGDLLLGDLLFRLQGGQWLMKDAWLTNELIHDQGRNLVAVLLLTLLTAIGLSHFTQSLRPYRKGLYYVLVCALITVAIVNLMKQYSALDCPWDLTRYGGDKVFISLFEPRLAGQGPGACFPAGHASGAYCWLGLFFLARHYWPRWRFRALGGVLTLGLVFGIAQQLRGAHFVSHDLWTLYISWMSACLCYFYLLRMEPMR